MLVTRRTGESIVARLKRLPTDAGSTMVTVLIVMLVLTTGGLTLSAIAMNTTGSVTSTRDRSAAQAEVDGAIATQSVELMSGRLKCDFEDQQSGSLRNGTESDPNLVPVNWTLDCEEAGTVVTATIQARTNVNGEEALKMAVFTYSLTPPAPANYGAPADPIMMFGDNTTFNSNNVVADPAHPVNVSIPYGNFTCNTRFPGNLVVKGNIVAENGCQVSGNLISVAGTITGPGLKVGGDMVAHGNITLNGGTNVQGNVYSRTGIFSGVASDLVTGNLNTGGTGENKINGNVGGSVHLSGGISSYGSNIITGSVIAGGNSSLGAMIIKGTLSVPSSKSLNVGWAATVSGVRAVANPPSTGISRPATIPDPSLPTMPTLPTWFEYKYKASDWTGYEVVELAAVGVGPGSCTGFQSSQGTWLTEKSATSAKPLIIDARKCTSALSTNYGGGADIRLSKNLVLLANEFDLTNARVSAAAGVTTKPRVWVLKSDENPADIDPTCSPSGATKLNMSHFDPSVATMVYTPCAIQVNGASSLYGQLYGGDWNGGGGAGITFGPDNIGLPGMDGTPPPPLEDSENPGGEIVAGSFQMQSSRDLPIP